MAVLKALKKIFGKAEGQTPNPSQPVAPRAEHVKEEPTKGQSGRPAKQRSQATSDQAPQPKAKSDRPRRAQPAKPVDTWKLEDFVVEPAEGKTRFHDFKLSPELMHAIHDLGFPYCTPIQAQVLGFTLSGRDAIGRAQTGTGKTAAFLVSIITQLLQTPAPKERYMGEPRALIIAPDR
jgi:ATP-dependent RNA helicase RhlB